MIIAASLNGALGRGGLLLTLVAATFGIWLANPYLALLLVPTAHLWAFGSLLRGQLGPAIAIGAAGLLLPLLALVYTAAQLGSGLSAPWQLLLMFTGRHFGPLAAVPLCLFGACLVALLTIAATRPGLPPEHHPALRRGVVPVNKVARNNLAKDPVLKEILLLDAKDVGNMAFAIIQQLVEALMAAGRADDDYAALGTVLFQMSGVSAVASVAETV